MRLPIAWSGHIVQPDNTPQNSADLGAGCQEREEQLDAPRNKAARRALGVSSPGFFRARRVRPALQQSRSRQWPIYSAGPGAPVPRNLLRQLRVTLQLGLGLQEPHPIMYWAVGVLGSQSHSRSLKQKENPLEGLLLIVTHRTDGKTGQPSLETGQPQDTPSLESRTLDQSV